MNKKKDLVINNSCQQSKVCRNTYLSFDIAKDVQNYTAFLQKVCIIAHLRCVKLHTIF